MRGAALAAILGRSASSGAQVKMTGQTDSIAGVPKYTLQSGGAAVLDGVTISGEWLLTGVNTDYEVAWTLVSWVQATGSAGYTMFGTAGTYYGLGTTRVCQVNGGGVSTGTLNFTLKIRRVSDLAILATASFTLDNT